MDFGPRDWISLDGSDLITDPSGIVATLTMTPYAQRAAVRSLRLGDVFGERHGSATTLPKATWRSSRRLNTQSFPG